MNNIPPELREQLSEDPEYQTCMRNVILNDHTCKADPMTRKLIEWEHALYYNGRELQERWAIIPLCWWAHRGPGPTKEINVWIALNRATDEELLKYDRANFIQQRNYLNKKYLRYA